MNRRHLGIPALALGIATLSLPVGEAVASDWPQWGRTATKNMSAPDVTGLPSDFYPGDFVGATDEIDQSTTRNIKWIAKLGSQSYGNPTVANGLVFVGTNNDTPRDPRLTGDRSTVYCFDEKTGEFKWQLNVPKMGTGKVSDWEYLGICSSPTIDGDRIYLVTNLCEVICLDVDGQADGNDGPYKDEGKYMAGKDLDTPIEVTPKDADIIWVTNMIDESGVFPHNITSSSVLVAGDKLWVTTSNGVDYGHVETPAPYAPCLVMLDKNTGELLAEEASGLSQRIFHANWTSPAYMKTDDVELCIFGGPDGWCYAFSPEPTTNEDGDPILKEVWRYDCNPPEYRVHRDRPARYATRGGPSEIISTPVTYGNRVYVTIGQDPEHGEGVGNLSCIDATKTGNVTDTAKVWEYRLINRSLSTPSIVDDIVYVADFSGFVYAFDANTGENLWKHDTKGHIWGSTLVADGKVFVGNEDGYLTILKAGKEMELLGEIDMMAPVYSSPIAANGVLYVATHTHLFAIDGDEPAPSGEASE